MDSSGNQDICRFFINGCCRFGSRCIYRHEMPVIPSSQICRYFHKGTCWFGEHCNYLHVLQPEANRAPEDRRGSPSSVVQSSSQSFSQSDRRGSEPTFLQAATSARRVDNNGMLTVSSSHDGAHSSANIAVEQAQDAELDSAQTSEVTQVGASPATEESSVTGSSISGASAAAEADPGVASTSGHNVQSKAEVVEAFFRSKDVICGICLDKVYEKPDPRNHVFGILPNCSHSYCLQCIKSWRKTKDLGPDLVKTCPECRVNSAFYVPNKYWVEGEAKDSLIVAFKDKLRKRRCSFFARYGCCPFKMDCLHRHDGPTMSFPQYTAEEDDEEYALPISLLGLILALSLPDNDEDEDIEIPLFLRE